jgi:iron complex outermembrane receptor protein
MKASILSFLLLLSAVVFGQTGQIKGLVTTTDGKSVANATISIESLKIATVTDEDGQFFFTNIKPGHYKLILSFVGLEPQHQTLSIQAGKAVSINFSIKENAKQLDEVVVTTNQSAIKRTASFSKAGLAPLDNPQSIGVVSRVIIQDQQAQRLGDVVKNVSGVSITQQRQGVAETFSARGYSIGIGGGSGSIFKNGIVSNTTGFPEASTLESIEVLKGSSALLYGNTSGGVIINMVTKKPKFDWGGEVSLRTGSYDLFKPVVDLYGPISKNLAFRVVSTYEKANSFRDGVHTERLYINPSLLYNIGKKTSLLLQADYLDSDFTPDNGIGALNQNMDPVIIDSRKRFLNTSWAYYNSKTASGSLTLDHKFNDFWKFNLIGAVQSVKVNAFGTGVPNAVAANGDWNRSLSRTGTEEFNHTLQANLIGRFKTGKLEHQVLVGTDYVGITTNTNAFRITSADGKIGSAYDKINILDMDLYQQRTDIPNTVDTSRTKSPSYRLGYYAQDLVSLSHKFKVLVGLRYSYLETQKASTSNFVKDTVTYGAAAFHRALSPKAALIYQPIENMSIYTGYTNSFTTNTGTDIYGNALKPSIIDQFEIGWKNIFFNGKFGANLSVYRIINSNLAQQAITLADGTPNTSSTIKELTGQTTSDGFEIDFNGTLSKNIYFLAGYGFNHARYTKTSGIKGSAIEGERLINNPKHTANGTLFYTFNKTALKGLKLGVAAFYTGKRFGGVQNTVGQTPEFNRQIPLKGFTTVDFSAGYSFNKISVLAKISNIGNTLNYLVHDRYSINPIAPRQFMATLSYKF